MNTYKTTDLYLATHLICSGVKLINIQRIDPKRAELVFEKPEEALINSYFEETKKFSAQKILNKLKSLKTRIYNAPLKD